MNAQKDRKQREYDEQLKFERRIKQRKKPEPKIYKKKKYNPNLEPEVRREIPVVHRVCRNEELVEDALKRKDTPGYYNLFLLSLDY